MDRLLQKEQFYLTIGQLPQAVVDLRKSGKNISFSLQRPNPSKDSVILSVTATNSHGFLQNMKFKLQRDPVSERLNLFGKPYKRLNQTSDFVFYAVTSQDPCQIIQQILSYWH